MVAYLAGFFDGEGSIRIGKSYRARKEGEVYYYLLVTVNQLDAAPLYLLQNLFNGTVTQKKSYNNHRPAFSWEIAATGAKYCLETMLPYLTVKKEQAKVGIEFQA